MNILVRLIRSRNRELGYLEPSFALDTLLFTTIDMSEDQRKIPLTKIALFILFIILPFEALSFETLHDKAQWEQSWRSPALISLKQPRKLSNNDRQHSHLPILAKSCHPEVLDSQQSICQRRATLIYPDTPTLLLEDIWESGTASKNLKEWWWCRRRRAGLRFVSASGETLACTEVAICRAEGGLHFTCPAISSFIPYRMGTSTESKIHRFPALELRGTFKSKDVQQGYLQK